MASPSAASQVLADRLHSRRMESMKGRRKTDFGPIRPGDFDDDREDLFLAEAQASTDRAGFRGARRQSIDTPSRPGSMTSEKKRQLGLREMDDKLQKLEKLNFDLKMEVFHRREREEKLQQQVRDMHKQLQLTLKMQEEHSALLRLNKSLSTELEKSNEAVDQAVGMICDLEAKVEELEQRALHRSQSASCSDSGYAASTAAGMNVPPTPTRRRISVLPSSPRQPRSKPSQEMTRNRVPSFMVNPATDNMALRETYGNQSAMLKETKSFLSFFSSVADEDEGKLPDLPSPQLSELSEGGLATIYQGHGMGRESLYSIERTPRKTVSRNSHSVQDSVKRVSKWIELERNSPEHEYAAVDNDSVLGIVVNDPPTDTDESTRPSTNDSSVHPQEYPGWPDGGSIVTGTPSRFRSSSGMHTIRPCTPPRTKTPVSPTPRKQAQPKRMSLVTNTRRLLDKFSKPEKGRLSRSSTAADISLPSKDKAQRTRAASLSRTGAQAAWERGR